MTPRELRSGSRAYQQNVPRDSTYKTATFLVRHFWGDAGKMADGLGVLLLTWNHGFYRYGELHFADLEMVLKGNMRCLSRYRSRGIQSLTQADSKEIERLFGELRDALRIDKKNGEVAYSPVSVAKVLHLLAPRFFPLWDNAIANAYHSRYARRPASKYVDFCFKIKGLRQSLRGAFPRGQGRSCLKVIDEYNYAKFTKKWI